MEHTEGLPKRKVSYDNVRFNLNHLQGKILTVIEATVDINNQEATKSLIRSIFVDTHNVIIHASIPENKCGECNITMKEIDVKTSVRNQGIINEAKMEYLGYEDKDVKFISA